MSAKKFINDPVNVVEEMIQGALAVHSDTLVRLEGFTVLLHREIETIKQSQVVILSGGGSGHEPAHAGFIGRGMLSGAILGGVFASPSISSILAAIRSAAGPKGVLLIIKNYTGDRINFGQAALMAQAQGIKVATVVVADDCALPEGKGVTGGRGVAGAVFVHKVAGAVAASKSASLEEVHAAAKVAAESVKTLGVAMTTCTVPGTASSDRLDKDTIEIGLGIHGEPGMRQSPWQSADTLAEEMVAVTLGRLTSAPKKVALLVNNLGGTPTMEIFVMVHACCKALGKRGIEPQRIVSGALMTSLEMQGVSVSVLPLDDDGDGNLSLLACLDSPTTAPAWPAVSQVSAASSQSLVKPVEALSAPPALADTAAAAAAAEEGKGGGEEKAADTGGGKSGKAVLRAIKAVCEALSAAEPELTNWDQVAGDGDCGITFQRGAKQVLEDCPSYPLADSAKTCAALADSISSSMGGTSGALLEIFFRAACLSHRATTSTDSPAKGWALAFCAGTEKVREIGGAEAGYRTMLDALLPAVAALSAALPASGDTSSSSSSLRSTEQACWASAVEAAEAGADATKGMAALAGRSNYVNDELLKAVPDPGAKAVAFAMRAGFDAATASDSTT